MVSCSLLALFGVGAYGAGAALAAVHERIGNAPRGWSLARQALLDEQIKLEISLREHDLPSFEQQVLDISTPGHARYGQHFTSHDQIADLIRPRDESYAAVHDWLEAHQVHHIVADGDMIEFHTNVSNAERMLATKFAWFSRDADSTEAWVLRTTQYSLPSSLSGHVNFVHPTIKFPSIRSLRSTITTYDQGPSAEALQRLHDWQAAQLAKEATVAPPDAICCETITPQCLLKLYNVHYGAEKANNTVAFASFLEEYARYTDLATFEDTQATYAKGDNFSVVQFNGGGNDQTSTSDATEANLDCQYVVGLTHPLRVREYSTGGCGPIVPDESTPAGSCSNEPYMRFLTSILKQSNSQLPQTLSISYGDDEQTWPRPLAQKVCSMLSRLTARGVTILFASGDSSVGDNCQNNDRTQQVFVPNFPASCPWVTTVGATQSIPEQLASFSGGGFSNYFPFPSYQHAAVSAFLAKDTAFRQYYNASGRGYPDVAAQGVNFLTVVGGETEAVSGTSAAAPTFAGIVALLNAARASIGRAPLGFLNPLLYQNPAALNDITVGSTSGCTAGRRIVGAGFNATVGWEPAAGLGTPDFGKLLAIVAPGVENKGGPLPA